MASNDWSKDCPNLKSINENNYIAKYNSYRWGRKGIDFFNIWYPNIFAGVILDIFDHSLEPLDSNKGPDVVIFVETYYKKTNLEIMNKRNSILSSEAFIELKNRLQINHGTFDYLPGIDRSPWRVIVLRKSLFDVLKGKYTINEQVEALYETYCEGINLLTQDNLLKKACENIIVNESNPI